MFITISKKSLIFPPPPVRNKDVKYISPFFKKKKDWWMLKIKMLWRPSWPNQLQRANHTLSVTEQRRADALIEIQTESTMTNRLPISSSVCRQPLTRSKGCPETLWDSLNLVCWSFIPNTDAAPPPHHMISHERSENNSIFHKGVQTGSPRHQPWQAPVISSAMAFRSISWLARRSSSVLFMHLEVFVNSSEGSHTERNKGCCVLHNIRGSSDIKVWERLL